MCRSLHTSESGAAALAAIVCTALLHLLKHLLIPHQPSLEAQEIAAAAEAAVRWKSGWMGGGGCGLQRRGDRRAVYAAAASKPTKAFRSTGLGDKISSRQMSPNRGHWGRFRGPSRRACQCSTTDCAGGDNEMKRHPRRRTKLRIAPSVEASTDVKLLASYALPAATAVPYALSAAASADATRGSARSSAAAAALPCLSAKSSGVSLSCSS